MNVLPYCDEMAKTLKEQACSEAVSMALHGGLAYFWHMSGGPAVLSSKWYQKKLDLRDESGTST